MAKRKALNLLDLSFVLMESKQTPMHVAGLQTFVPPSGAPRDFHRQVYEYLRSFPVTTTPFNYRLRGIGHGSAMPTFETVDEIDLDYHLRHSTLSRKSGERELDELVSRLHSTPMDLDRPLWEVHLIGGLPGTRFAIYAKIHHSLVDGKTGIGLINYSENPDESRTPPAWTVKHARKSSDATPSSGGVGALRSALVEQARAIPSLLQGLAGSTRASFGMNSDPDFTSLVETPRTIFNLNITGQRRVTTYAAGLERVKSIGTAAGGSVNDVLLAACAGALRKYLLELDKLPAKSLVAAIPVALAREPRDAGGNAVSLANVRLATDIENVRERFEAIRRSSVAGRAHLAKMTNTALLNYTVMISSPQVLTRIPGVGSLVPLMCNLIISNVPGPREKLYFLGARMDAYFPISALNHGQALNITVMSYAGGLYFGYTSCQDRVPSVQKLAVYTGEALDELETTFIGRLQPKRKAVNRKRARKSGA